MSNAFTKMLKTQNNNFDKLTKKLSDSSKGGKSFKDERIWSLKRDESDNGYAVIRFLPTSQKSELPVVTIFDHWFKGPGGYYTEKSLSTIGQEDPLGEYNGELWNNGTDEGKEQARKQKRRMNYYSNILVIKDPAAPENEGKVFLYRYGKKIMDKLSDLMVPEFPDEEPINPYDFMEGCNFKIKVRKVDGWINYDKSGFDQPSPLFKGDEGKLEALWNKQYELDALLDPSEFKTYAELKKHMNKVLGLTTVSNEERYGNSDNKVTDEKDSDEDSESNHSSKDEAKDWDSGDDDASFFQDLANS